MEDEIKEPQKERLAFDYFFSWSDHNKFILDSWSKDSLYVYIHIYTFYTTKEHNFSL